MSIFYQLLFTYKLNLFKEKLDIDKYEKRLISKYIFILFIQRK